MFFSPSALGLGATEPAYITEFKDTVRFSQLAASRGNMREAQVGLSRAMALRAQHPDLATYTAELDRLVLLIQRDAQEQANYANSKELVALAKANVRQQPSAFSSFFSSFKSEVGKGGGFQSVTSWWDDLTKSLSSNGKIIAGAAGVAAVLLAAAKARSMVR